MKKKRFLFMVLALILSLSLLGCGKGGESDAGEQGDHDHAHGDFEWIGEFELTAGTYMFHFGASEDETMDVGFVKIGDNISDLEHHGSHLMATDKEVIEQDSIFTANPDYAYTFQMNPHNGNVSFTIEDEGKYAIITEHLPEESSMQIFNEDKEEMLPYKVHEIEGHDH